MDAGMQQEHIVKKIMESYEQVDFIFGTHNILVYHR